MGQILVGIVGVDFEILGMFEGIVQGYRRELIIGVQLGLGILGFIECFFVRQLVGSMSFVNFILDRG